jgi:hypothetical protein
MKKPRRNQKIHPRRKKIASISNDENRKPLPAAPRNAMFTKAMNIATWFDRVYRLYRYCQKEGYIPPGDEIWRAIKEAVSALT